MSLRQRALGTRAGWEEAAVEERIRQIEEDCRRMNLPVRRKRQVIIQVLAEMEDHPDSFEIRRRAALLDPDISPATIYRTLNLFEQAGILQRRDFGDGRAHYEIAHKSPHHHMIDLTSGAVIDFRARQLDALARQIASEMGFELVDFTLDLYGKPPD